MEYFVYSVFFILTVVYRFPWMICETQTTLKDLLIPLPVLNYF